MSRIGNKPITLPKGVTLSASGQLITVKGAKGELKFNMSELIDLKHDKDEIVVAPRAESSEAKMFAGTTRASLANLVQGVSEGFVCKLVLVGVGYRAKVAGNKINLTLGFSHPIDHDLPKGVSAECPSQTEIILKSADKQLLGQVAADIRNYRPPEPYKGKGVRYEKERIILKETKKK